MYTTAFHTATCHVCTHAARQHTRPLEQKSASQARIQRLSHSHMHGGLASSAATPQEIKRPCSTLTLALSSLTYPIRFQALP